MSGRKYTEIQLSASIERFMSTCQKAKESVREVGNLLWSLQSCAQDNVSLQPAIAGISENLKDLKQKLMGMEAMLSPTVLKEKGLEEVEKQQGETKGILCRLDQMKQKCLSGQKALAFQIRLRVLYSAIEQEKERLVHWYPDDLKEFKEKWEKELGRVEAALQNLTDMQTDTETIAVLEHAFYDLLGKVKECEEKHARRSYVIEAIKKVCAEMGFSVRKETMGNPHEAVHLEIETFAFGIMSFEFPLAGSIQSFSNYAPGQCEGTYLDLTEKLKGLGVISDFHYEESGVPLRKMAELRDFFSNRQNEAEA